MKDKKQWYYTAEKDGFGEFYYVNDINLIDDRYINFYGPFNTFTDAKKDAIEYYVFDIERAKRSLKDLRKRRKPKDNKNEKQEN